jgi:hypothetical protein
MKKGILVYHNNFERGIVENVSPSGSIISVRFKNFGYKAVLSSTLEIIR